MLDKFIKFTKDPEASEFFITGVAGTGKTTSLKELLEYCISNKINTVTCAYTHQAVRVLRSKVPMGEFNVLCTLHSYLQKRPTINEQATKIAHVEGNSQVGIPSRVDIVFIDEFSMVGERDYVDIADLQYNEEGELVTKIVYIGDPNQLPPVKDMQAITPHEPYWVKLTKIYRQAGDNPLIDTLISLNDYINGKPAEPLEPHEKFVRGQDIIAAYSACKTSKILLAFTNATVQSLNAQIQGREAPLVGDELFSPTVRKVFSLEGVDDDAFYVINIRGDLVEIGSKYKTLETLIEIPGVRFYTITEDTKTFVVAAVFGHDDYLQMNQELARAAVKANKKIEVTHKENPKQWARDNWADPLAQERRKAWANYLAFKECVMCLDFNHAMTIHKSQGSTFENVFLDMEDISKCANSDYQLYLKLLYVAISRASDTVYTN